MVEELNLEGLFGEFDNLEVAEEVHEEADELTVDITPCQSVPAVGGDRDVAIRINVPELKGEIPPVDICCVIDVSSSMSSYASYESCDGEGKNAGFSVLDIVKHATNAVFSLMSANDRISLVVFASNTAVIFPLTAMNQVNLERSRRQLLNLRTKGRTNLWKGLFAGMEELRKGHNEVGPERKKSLLLLTDGVPNEHPAFPLAQGLRDYIDQYPKFKFQVNTFGFGYDLQSDVLLSLAQEGHGSYAFIPVAPNVGTVFVDAVSNILSTYTGNASLRLVVSNGGQFNGDVFGDYQSSDESWGKFIHLGPLQYGQSREIVIPMTIPSGEAQYLEAVVSYKKANVKKETKVSGLGASRVATPDSHTAYIRSKTVNVGARALELAHNNQIDEANRIMKDLDIEANERCE